MNKRIHRLARDLMAIHIHPETRERIPWVERGKTLDRFRGRSDVFGSFTEIFKLGINPQTRYNTPVAICSYPVDHIINNIKDGEFKVEFQGSAPYLHIFSVNNLSSCLFFLPGTGSIASSLYAKSSLPGIMPKYYALGIINKVRDFLLENEEEFRDNATPYGRDPDPKLLARWYRGWIYRLGNYTEISDYEEFLEKALMTACLLNINQIEDLSQEMAQDHGYSVEDAYTRLKVYFINKKSIIDADYPYKDKVLKILESVGTRDYLSVIRSALTDNITSNQGFVWSITRHISGKNPFRWTELLRRMGFTGAIDHGTGTIHPNEPTQAIFFDMRNITVLDVIDNKKPDQYRSEETTGLSLSKQSREPDKYVHDNVVYVNNLIGTVLSHVRSSGDDPVPQPILNGIKVYLDKLTRLIGWLNMHGQGDSDWVNNKRWVREQIRLVRERISDPDIIKKLDKITRSLGRP